MGFLTLIALIVYVFVFLVMLIDGQAFYVKGGYPGIRRLKCLFWPIAMFLPLGDKE